MRIKVDVARLGTLVPAANDGIVEENSELRIGRVVGISSRSSKLARGIPTPVHDGVNSFRWRDRSLSHGSIGVLELFL